MEEKGIATEIKEGLAGVKTFFFDLFGSKNKETYKDNPNVIYDEILLAAWVISICCVAITTYFGVSYHMSIFHLSTGDGAAGAAVLSIGVLLIGEYIKVYLGVRIGRMMFIANSKGTSKLKKFALWLFLVTLAYFTFVWSIDISALAFGDNTANAKRNEALKQTGNYSSITKDYDEQIASIQEDIKKAKKQTWQGKLTPDAIDLIKRLDKSKSKILDQKNKAIDMASKKDSTFLTLQNGTITKTEARLNDYGGKAEWLLIILIIFVIPICESILHAVNEKDKKNKENDNDDDQTGAGGAQGGTQFFSMQQRNSPAFNASKPIVESKVERTPIGFKYSGEKKAEDSKKIVDDKKKRPNITRKL